MLAFKTASASFLTGSVPFTPTIVVLASSVSRCLDDVDDEVRDRAALYLRVFKEKSLAQTFVQEGVLFSMFILNLSYISSSLESVFSLAALETKLVAYMKDPEAAAQPLDVSSVPRISRAQAAQEAARMVLILW